jgi:hypothetical protein
VLKVEDTVTPRRTRHHFCHLISVFGVTIRQKSHLLTNPVLKVKNVKAVTYGVTAGEPVGCTVLYIREGSHRFLGSKYRF